MSREKKSIIDKGHYDCKTAFFFVTLLGQWLWNGVQYARVEIQKDVLRQNNRDRYQCPLARTQDKIINI
jgi:hypothetical protein